MTTRSLHEARVIHVPDSPTVLKNPPAVGMFNSFEWMICQPPPVRLRDAQGVSLDDKLYVGGDIVSSPGVHGHLNFVRDVSRVYVYTPKSDQWTTIDTPVYWFALATYHSQLVLVGGREYTKKYDVDLCTNKLWTLNELVSDQWELLQPMNIRRYMPSAVSHEEYLLVAGGAEDEDDLESDVANLLDVEVYDGSCWTTMHQPLPVNPGSYMKSACLAGNWYLGGFEDDKGVYFASLDTLISSHACEMPLSSTIWKRLPDVPDFWSVIPAVFANRSLIALGASSTIYAFSFYTHCWNPVGDLRLPMNCICAVTMRSGDLIIVGGEIDDPNAANIILKATANSKCLRSVIHGLKKENEKLKGENKKLMDQLSLSFSKPDVWNMRGIEECGEMTVVIYSYDQQITWPGYGLRLHIPDGCLPAGMEQCTINIKASLAGQYEFPENFHLVSAVFWLRCGDVQRFTRPITVDIQHCAESLKLKFVRAVCSQKQLPYTFKQLPGGNFTSHMYRSYGAIELNSFSGVGIAQEGSAERQYYCKLFYFSNYFGGHRIDLAISWNTEAHISEVKKHYNRERALPGPDQPVQFEGEEIRLDFPMEETKINDKWTIVPLIDPVVTKNEVDSYQPGKRIPHCELAAHPLEEPVTRLVHRVILLGARPPRNKFTLSYMPPTASSVGSPQVNEPGKPKLKDLQKELYSKVAKEWEDIGIQLEIEEGQLKQIKSDNAGDSKACLREMLRVWLSRVAPPPSWSAMADALDTLGYQDIATHLRTVYMY